MSEVERFIRFCQSEFGGAVMDREAEFLAQFVKPGDRILDIGAGIGSIESRLPEYDIIGLDISSEMIQTARSRVDGDFILGDARHLPVADATMDVTFSVATLEFIAGWEVAIEEAIRILKPDGVFVAFLLNTDSSYVQSNLAREGSYFQRMVADDTSKLATTVEEYVEGTREYFLGIDDGEIIESNDPTEAAILAVYGTRSTELARTDHRQSVTDRFS